MVVKTSTPELERSRLVLTELLISDQPPRAEDPKQTTTADNLLLSLADGFGVARETTALPCGSGRGTDSSNPVINVDHDACILCDRCVRACDDIQGNDVIGRSGKGYATRIAFDLNDPMGASSCVTCGECVQACPTGALTNKAIGGVPIRPRSELDGVDSVCPYCGVGCALTYYVDRGRGAISFAEGRAQPGSQSQAVREGPLRLGLRRLAAAPHGAAHPPSSPPTRRGRSRPTCAATGGGARATTGGRATAARWRPERWRPRKDGRPGKDRGRKPGGLVDYDEVLPHFREASWDEALGLVARRLKEIHAAGGQAAIAGFGSAKCSNEEAYLFQKLIRTGFGSNNVDHCTRLCHASSVAALFEGVGSGAVSTTYGDVANADVVIITGSNPTANHPVASSFFKQARRRGTKIIYVDPRASTVAEHADIFVQLKPGTDVAFYNSIMHEVIRLGLTDDEFVAERTSNYEELARTVADYPPERAAQITGVNADMIREVARTWGEAGAAVVYWGMGISQHTTGTDNARCLIALCSITGNVGRPGTGLHPLRGQNNVQGASDAGLIPMFYPDYQGVDREATQRLFEEAWGMPLNPNRGLTVTEIIKSVLQPDGVRGMYMLGENPFLSDPNINKVRKALSSLDFLVVQDIFLTETAEFADVILPATSYLEKDGTYTNTDRRVQLGRKVMDPPGEARPDWEIVQEIAQRIGLHWSYGTPSEVFDEMVALMPSYENLSYDNLGLSGKLYPNADPEHSDGTIVMFGEKFNTDDGLAHLVPAQWLPAEGAARRRVPARAQHRTAARALAHGLDDSALVRPRRHLARGRGLHAPEGRRGSGAHPRRDGEDPFAAGLDRVAAARQPPRAAGQLLHPVPLPGGGGQPPHDRRDRPVRQDPRVQVLRRAGGATCACPMRARRPQRERMHDRRLRPGGRGPLPSGAGGGGEGGQISRPVAHPGAQCDPGPAAAGCPARSWRTWPGRPAGRAMRSKD